MHVQRPSTAPCRRPTSEDWTQVDALLRDMFSTVASAATSSTSELPRRPHTACVCAQLVDNSKAQSSDEESDGASIDEYSDEEPDTPASRCIDLTAGRAWLKGQHEQRGPLVSPLACSSTAPCVPTPIGEDDNEHYADCKAVAKRTGLCKSPGLPSEKALLLGGQLWGRASSSASITSENGKCPPKDALVKKTPVVSEVLAKSAAKKLPKQCLFMGFNDSRQMPNSGKAATAKPRRGLAPAAAKLRSHVSWAHHLPIRISQPVATATSIAASTTPETVREIETSLANGTTCSVEAVIETANVSRDVNEVRQEPAAPSEEAPIRKKAPRYYFAPGSSRPVLASRLAPKRDAMVLEFRTEPRVVPASRAPAKRSERRSEAFRFRPKSREWATERDVLAMH